MRLCGDLVLREICTPVSDYATVKDIMSEMLTMIREQRGVGMAAPQIGIGRRFVVMLNPDDGMVYNMINPRVVSLSDKTCKMEEGCLSVLDNTDTPIFADVIRPESVSVEWIDENGLAHTENFDGYLARIAQHEIDHLDGKLFIDYLSPIKREQVMRKVKKRK